MHLLEGVLKEYLRFVVDVGAYGPHGEVGDCNCKQAAGFKYLLSRDGGLRRRRLVDPLLELGSARYCRVARAAARDSELRAHARRFEIYTCGDAAGDQAAEAGDGDESDHEFSRRPRPVFAVPESGGKKHCAKTN